MTMIANRLSTICEASRIVEIGSHDELLDRRGVYFNLYTMQFRAETAEAADRGTSLQHDKSRKPDCCIIWKHHAHGARTTAFAMREVYVLLDGPDWHK
jgi:hypothetical protein